MQRVQGVTVTPHFGRIEDKARWAHSLSTMTVHSMPAGLAETSHKPLQARYGRDDSTRSHGRSVDARPWPVCSKLMCKTGSAHCVAWACESYLHDATLQGIDFYEQFHVLVLGLDSVEARRYMNSIACSFLGARRSTTEMMRPPPHTAAVWRASCHIRRPFVLPAATSMRRGRTQATCTTSDCAVPIAGVPPAECSAPDRSLCAPQSTTTRGSRTRRRSSRSSTAARRASRATRA